jgi:formylglycine-generating enzyme required for sulfatase activity
VDPYGNAYAPGDLPEGGPPGEADPATVSGFRLDKYEVTVGRFRQFVSALNSGYGPSIGSGKHAHLNGGLGLVDSSSYQSYQGTSYEDGWSPGFILVNPPIDTTCEWILSPGDYITFTTSPNGNEKLPVNCLSWSDAYAFCIWDDAFLPSEAEWEFAAAGGGEQREYPWGPADPGVDSQYAIYGCYYNGSGFDDAGVASCTGVKNIAPVGTAALGAGLWGHLDLSGNVSEWVLDTFPNANARAPYVNPCVNCAYLAPSYQAPMTQQNYSNPHVARGSEFYYQNATAAYRNTTTDDPSADTGFRCARTP